MEDKFIFCLEAVEDVDTITVTETLHNLEKLAFDQGIGSIHQTCDSIEGLETALMCCCTTTIILKIMKLYTW